VAYSAPRIRLTWQFTFRGQPELFSNTYWFDKTPGSRAAWRTLAISYLAAAAAGVFTDDVTLVAADCYIGSGSPVVQHFDAITDPSYFPVDGVLAFTASATEVRAPGDAAAWIRFLTDRRTSRGKPIYVRQYYHGMVINPPDTLLAAQKTALETFAGELVAGLTALPYYIADGFGHPVSDPAVPTYITHRDLERRGSSPL
jgi:hypothetical protein